MGSCVPLETLQDRGTPPSTSPPGHQSQGTQTRSHPGGATAGAGDPGGSRGSPGWIPADAAHSHLVVHDGAEAHDAHMDIVLLADEPRVAQRLPAVRGVQPGRGERGSAGPGAAAGAA